MAAATLTGFYTNVDRYKNSIRYRGYDENGKRVTENFRFKPTLYLESKNENISKWCSLEGVPLEPVRFECMSEARAFIKQYENIPNFKVYGNDKWIPAFIQSQFPNRIDAITRFIDVCYIDIETDCDEDGSYSEAHIASNQILTITVKSSKSDTYIIWGLKPYDHKDSRLQHLKVDYREFSNETKMLHDFIDWWSDIDNTPDVVTGWNISFYDIPYLINRLSRVVDSSEALKMSPWGEISEKNVITGGQEKRGYTISGIQQLDYLELFKKFTLNTYGQQESYALDHIAEVVLEENKIEYNGTLKNLYETDYTKYVDYNIVDVELVTRFENKLGLINLVFTLAYFGGVNYTETLGTVGIWDSIIFRYLANKFIAVPPNKSSNSTKYAGGYVKDPKPGMYDWTMSFDLNSLYPNIIIQYNMSPETLVRHSVMHGLSPETILKNHVIDGVETNLAVAANGATFRRDKQGFLPAIIEDLYNRRVIIKKTMLKKQQEYEISKTDELTREISRLDTEQMCIKILMNSCYGAIGNQYFRYFDLLIAEGITLTGQLVINYAEKAVNEYLNKFLQNKTEKDYVIAMDTDSIYIDVNDVIRSFRPKEPVKFLDEFGSKAIEPLFKKSFGELADITNAFKNTMNMKREVIADRAIWTAKKRYIMNVHNSEGVQYAKPKIKIKGIEAVKSSTPKICREMMKDLFGIIMTGSEQQTQEAIKKMKDAFIKLDSSKIGIPRKVSNVRKYFDRDKIWTKGTPLHSRAALVHNHLCQTHNLKHIPKIQNGEKIKYIFLKEQNPTKSNAIGFVGSLPTEFKLENYIDYETQFEKAFLEPIELILKAIGWDSEEKSTLESFFN
jgi:DNA polymerase elongation subunit (family B)